MARIAFRGLRIALMIGDDLVPGYMGNALRCPCSCVVTDLGQQVVGAYEILGMAP